MLFLDFDITFFAHPTLSSSSLTFQAEGTATAIPSLLVFVNRPILLTSLTSPFQFTGFVVWGRSMGATAAVLCRHPSVDSGLTSNRSIVKFIARFFLIPSGDVRETDY
jgi:hypothetical protein